MIAGGRDLHVSKTYSWPLICNLIVIPCAFLYQIYQTLEQYNFLNKFSLNYAYYFRYWLEVYVNKGFKAWIRKVRFYMCWSYRIFTVEI